MPLDGLRALAVVLVIWCHFSVFGAYSGLNVGPVPVRYLGDFGFSGVFLFFILSGFLLFLPYARTLLENRPWPSVRTFYLRRALRILPLYYVALLVLLLPGGNWLHPQNAIPLTLIALLLHDMQGDASIIISWIDGPFWTLAIEWQFYLLLPWLALLLAKVAGSRLHRTFFLRLALGLAALVVLGLCIRWLAVGIHYAGGDVEPINVPGILGFAMKLLYGVKGKYLEVFALGMAVSILYVLVIERGGLAIQHRKLLGALAAGAAVAGLVSCLFWAAQAQRIPYSQNTSSAWIFVPPGGQLWEILGEWTLGLCFALLLIGVLFGAPTLQGLFSLPPLRFIGIISYSLYIWHYPILTLLSSTIVPSSVIPYLHFIALSSMVLLLVCSGSYYLIERPCARYRRALHTSPEGEINTSHQQINQELKTGLPIKSAKT